MDTHSAFAPQPSSLTQWLHGLHTQSLPHLQGLPAPLDPKHQEMASNLIKCGDGNAAPRRGSPGREDQGQDLADTFTWGLRLFQVSVGRYTAGKVQATVALAIFSWSQFFLRERQAHPGNNYQRGGGKGVNPCKGLLGRGYKT